MAIAAMLCFFPVLVNGLRGPDVGAAAAVELMSSYAAGELADLPPRADPDLPAVPLHGLEGRERARHDRRHRGRLLRRLAASSSAIQIMNPARAVPVRDGWAAILVACILGIGFYLACRSPRCGPCVAIPPRHGPAGGGGFCGTKRKTEEGV